MTYLASHARRRVPTLLALGAMAVLLALLAGCGSSDDDSNSGSSGAETVASAGEESGSAEGGIAEAKAQVEKYSGLPKSINYTEKLTKSVAGKNVYLSKPGVPVGEEVAKGVTAGAAELGIKLRVVDAGVTPESYKAAMQQIINANPKPDGIIFSGQEPSFFAAEMKQIEEAGIPVVASSVVSQSKAIKGRGIKVEDWYAGSALAADYVLSQTNGEGHVVVYDLANYPILLEGSGKGFTEEYERLCPGCSIERVAVRAEDIGTKLPGQVVSYIQKNPKTTWLFTGIGDMLIGVPQALKAAGLGDKVQAISYSGVAPNYEYILNGGQTAMSGYANIEGGWAMVNEIAQAMVGQEVEQPKQPLQIITKDDVEAHPEWVDAGWPGAEHYEEQFRALWADVAK
jgi:ribose transport system substrate-binding protein